MNTQARSIVLATIQGVRVHPMARALSPRCCASKLITPIFPHFTSPPRSTFLRFSRMEMDSSSIAGNANVTETTEPEDTLVQYVVLRRDLIDTWPLGSVVTQGCHASVAAIWAHKDDAHTQLYCSPSNLDNMHKVTLEVKSETQILNLSEKLKAGNIAHKLWIEQPENFATCLATKPYPKSVVSSYFKKLKLCK